jgi:hypothetical protein
MNNLVVSFLAVAYLAANVYGIVEVPLAISGPRL